jgi:hypothetical protein
MATLVFPLFPSAPLVVIRRFHPEFDQDVFELLLDSDPDQAGVTVAYVEPGFLIRAVAYLRRTVREYGIEFVSNAPIWDSSRFTDHTEQFTGELEALSKRIEEVAGRADRLGLEALALRLFAIANECDDLTDDVFDGVVPTTI